MAAAYVARDKHQNRDMTKVQCLCCQKYRYVATQCNQMFCTYCKRKGHVLLECQQRPRASSQRANLTTLNASSPAPATNTLMPDSTASSSSLSLDMVQQIIVNVFCSWSLK
eukprot:TRINITY_DN14012_c1_g1_i3.p1 TRINITY_DN14012_c1_g1~~TRINITY_DN14012_c1_g1_i3.p1  ORF type:complete len:111 (+),score=17.20 TRINITY_DN14012_c1_g1_i3:301-633(+)